MPGAVIKQREEIEMNIKLKCCCGAEIDIVDTKSCYAGNLGSSRMEDEKGRRYMSQVIADDWLAMHAKCLEPKTDKPEDTTKVWDDYANSALRVLLSLPGNLAPNIAGYCKLAKDYANEMMKVRAKK
jgi:hypothetical protein